MFQCGNQEVSGLKKVNYVAGAIKIGISPVNIDNPQTDEDGNVRNKKALLPK